MIHDGYFHPDGIVWKIHSDSSMVVGGIRALLEQALHPEAMAGVAAHSNFREDAWGRLQRTGDYVGTLTFGTRQEADQLSSRVRMIHEKLKLDDPKLLLWVHMAMVDAFLDTALRSGMNLTVDNQNEYIAEMVKFATLVGIPESMTPHDIDSTKRYFDSILPELSASDDAKRAALFIALPPLPPLLRFGTPIAPIWGGITSLAAASLPKWAKRLYGWPTLPGEEIATDLALKTARITLGALPKTFRESPQLKAARARMNQAS
ncbi:MAG: oxygenase MpaB family protein [Actinomycetota bacterium]